MKELITQGECHEQCTYSTNSRIPRKRYVNRLDSLQERELYYYFAVLIQPRGGHLLPNVLSFSYKKMRERAPLFKVSMRPCGPAFRGGNSTKISKRVYFSAFDN